MDWTETGPTCQKHKKLCMVKTGMREGPTHLKSFFICAVLDDPCSFSQKASDIQPVHCPVHSDQYVDLQAVIDHSSVKERRKYYRCPLGVKNKVNWCGHLSLTQKASSDSLKTLESKVKGESKVKEPLKGSTLQEPSAAERAVDSSSKDSAHLRTNLKYVIAKSNSKKNLLDQKDQITKSDSKTDEKCQMTKSDSMRAVLAEIDCASRNGSLSVRDQKKDPPAKKDQDLNKDQDLTKTHRLHETQVFNGLTDQTKKNSAAYDLSLESLTISNKQMNSDGQSQDKKLFGSVSDHRSKVRDGACVQPKDKINFVKAHSLLNKAVANDQKPINNSFSYRDSSVIEVSDDSDSDVAEKNSEDENEVEDCNQFKAPRERLSADEFDTRGPKIVPGTSAPQVRVATGNQTVSDSSARPSTIVVLKESNPGGLKDMHAFAHLKSLSYYELLLKRQELTKATDQYQMLFKRVCGLPDGGQKIKDHIDRLKMETSHCNLLIEERKDQVKELGSVGDMLPKQVNIQEKGAGRQTQLIDTQVPTSSHVIHQMFGAQSHGNLYGGRMTTSRLEQVGQVTSEAIERLHRQFETCPLSEHEANDPDGLVVPLMRHQRQALAWLSWREEQHPPGGILADDMGLGKTLTMIALILAQRGSCDPVVSSKASWLNKEDQKKVLKSNATLVICPASLVHQWQKEIERRVRRGLLRVIVYHGTNREANMRSLASADVVITTYNIISREVGVPEEMKKDKNSQNMPVLDKCVDETAEAGSLLSILWNRIIIDEAHAIKNHKSLTAMSVSRLLSVNRWALTGTPIHNDLLDMYSLLRFLRCSPFDEYKLWKRQVDNKTEKGTQRLNMLIKTLLLRRTKDQTCSLTGQHLVELPKKHIEARELRLTDQERMLYDRIYKQSRAVMQEYLERQENKLLGKDIESTDRSKLPNPWSKDDHFGQRQTSGHSTTGSSSSGRAAPPAGGQILINLLRLRQCCSHLFLLKNALDTDDLQSDGMELDLVEQMNNMGLSEASGVKDVEVGDLSSVLNMDSPSTKVTELLNALKTIREQSPRQNPIKSVVVSQWTKMLEIVELHLKKAGFRCCTIKGSVAAKQRSDLVDTFNSDPAGPEVMLVSLRAGGVGLNLIGGNHLFLIDMHWNPALELQACDRIYRMGQKRDCFIHRFICKDTIEEKIVQLQNSKTALANNILSGNGMSNNKLTLADLRLLFGIGATEYNPQGYGPRF